MEIPEASALEVLNIGEGSSHSTSRESDSNWEEETEFLCNNLLFKFHSKKDELKQREKDLSDLKRKLEEEVQIKIKECDNRKNELENQYSQKIKVGSY